MNFKDMPKEQLKEIASRGGSAGRVRHHKEFCNRGHKLEGDNLLEVKRTTPSRDGKKIYTYMTYRCRECSRITARKYKRARTAAKRDKERDGGTAEKR
jgi:hypothetical protein